MPKVRKCQKCDKPPMEDRLLCKEHFAEYMQEYRQRDTKKRDSDNHQRGFEEGIRRVIRMMREKIAGKSIDGYTAAWMIEKACLTSEAPGVAERQKLIDSMRPWH